MVPRILSDLLADILLIRQILVIGVYSIYRLKLLLHFFFRLMPFENTTVLSNRMIKLKLSIYRTHAKY